MKLTPILLPILAMSLSGCEMIAAQMRDEPAVAVMKNKTPEPIVQGAVAQELEELSQEDVLNTDIYRPMVYVKMNNHSMVNSDLFQDYVMQSIQGMGFFENVVTKPPTAYINARPAETRVVGSDETWYDRVDPQSITDLREIYGQAGTFLIAEATLRVIAPNDHYLSTLPSWDRDTVFDIKLIDPFSGKTLFYLNHTVNSFNGAKLTMIDPVMQGAQQWLQDNAGSSLDERLPIPKLRGSGGKRG